jgi:hypothetical protein
MVLDLGGELFGVLPRDELYLVHEGGSGWDIRLKTGRAVAQVRWNRERSDATFLHATHALVPAFNNLPHAEPETEGFLDALEHLFTLDRAFIRNRKEVPSIRRFSTPAAGVLHLESVLDLGRLARAHDVVGTSRAGDGKHGKKHEGRYRALSSQPVVIEGAGHTSL